MDAKNHLLHAFQKPTMENVRILEEHVNKDAIAICARGQDKLITTAIFTMIAELPDIRNRNEIVTRLVNTAIKLIQMSRIDTIMSLQTILVILLKNIAVGPAFVTMHSNLSEELKLAIINCIEITCRRTTSNVIPKFYTKENLNILAQILSISENILAKENYKPLRIAAVKCMMAVFQVHNECSIEIKRQHQQIANCTFLLIPKIVSTLANVATGDSIVGETLIACSIDAIHRILHLIFADYSIQTNTTPNNMDLMKKPPTTSMAHNSAREPGQSVDDKLNALKSTERSNEWLLAASMKLCPIIRRLKKLTSLHSKALRMELFELSDVLLRNCQKNMNACIPALVEINVCLSENFEAHYSMYSEHVVDVAEELFVDHLINLPRIIYTGDESEQMVGFSQLQGVVRLLHATNRLKITISNDEIMEKFIAVLLLAIELERDNRLVEMNSCHNYDISETAMSAVRSHFESHTIAITPPWKNYKNLRTNNLIQKIHNTCKCISEQHQTHALILEFLLKLLTKNSINCNEALVLIQIFVIAASSSSTDSISCDSLHLAILEELGCAYRWQLQTHIDDQIMTDTIIHTNTDQWYEDRVEGLYESAISIRLSQIPTEQTDSIVRSKSITLKDIKNNILHICLLIETIGYYACKKQQQQKYQVYFMKILPLLIEKSSSEHYVIREAALMALASLKYAFNLNTTADLIFVNADYVTQSINTSLKQPDQIDNALRILNTATFYNSIESIPHLEGVVHNMILESSKLSQSKNKLSFMHAFKCILLNIREHNLRPNTATESIDCTVPSVQRHFTEWSITLAGVMNNILEEEEEEEEEDANVDGEEPAQTTEASNADEHAIPIPPHIQLTVDIVKQCIPQIASNNVDVKLMALECLTIGLDLIKDNEKELLPIVHSIWDPFMQQYIRNKSPVVLRYCFQFLRQVACHAKEFILQRSTKQLLPIINQYLKDLSKEYTAEKQQFLYEHSQEVKTLKEILIGLPSMLKALNVQERDFNNVLDAVSWILKKEKPRFLRSICENFIFELESFDICTVYVKLLESN